MSKPFLALVMPRYGRSVAAAGAARAFYGFRSQRFVNCGLFERATSLAIRCFNMLLCEVLNARGKHAFTHLAMIHDDICPDEGWADILHDELERTGADLISAVVPIKNPSATTSTAVDMMAAPWVVRRLTMKEVFDLPETFGLDDIPWRLPSSQLLVNTGLWMIRLDSGWVERLFPLTNPTGQVREAPLAFRDHARIVQLPSGEYAGEDVSEDWDWSRQLNTLGLRVMATRKVKLYHERSEYHNRSVWGAWDTDQGYQKCLRLLDGWRFPSEVSGWLTEDEGQALADLAKERRVLEIGSYYGRSTICMAQTAWHVWAVDPFDGRATNSPQDTLADFQEHLNLFGVANRVTVCPGTSSAVVPALSGPFDLVFIDGDHSYQAVVRDAHMAMQKLAPGGLLAFHDYRTHEGEYDGSWDPGVTRAVNELLAEGGTLLQRTGTVAVVRPAARASVNESAAVKPVLAGV